MKNQFFYTASNNVTNPEGTETSTASYMASFNMEKVIRSLELPDGTLIVILDDFHMENRQTVEKNLNGKPIIKVVPTTMQSEIALSKEDKERFYKLTNIESWKLEKC